MRKSVVIPWTLGFLIMGALMGLLLTISLSFVTELYLDYQYIVGVDFPQQLAALRLQASLLNERWAVDRHLSARLNGATDRSPGRTEAEAARAASDRNLRILQEATQEGPWDSLAADYHEYHALLDGLLYYSGEKPAQQETLSDQADDALRELLKVTSAIEADLQRQNRAAQERYHGFFQRRFQIILGLGLWLILAGAVTGLTLGRSFTRPLARLTEAARRLGQGDLTAEPQDMPASNEIGALAESFRQMTHSLRLAIERMRETAGALTSSSDRLSTSAIHLNDLVSGTRAQMEQIAQGAKAQREQMSVANRVAQSLAEAMQHSARQAGEAGQAAQGAHTRLQHAARTMDALGREATEIQNITAVIEQFAKETHMLSLNAAIEARRAGDAGRGFAAVSDEMRALAERSARSANEVTRFGARVQAEIESVGQAVKQVQEAVGQTARFAQQTADSARQQERETSTLATVIVQAATVSDDQAQIAGQVSTSAAEQADTVTELSSAASELTRLVNQLESLAARFATRPAQDLPPTGEGQG